MSETRFTITKIEPQQKAENRFNIYLDGAFAFGLEGEVLIRHHLHEGDEIAENIVDDVLLSEERSKAKKKALALLSHSSRSVAEIRRRLLESDFSERTSDRVIRDFVRVGLLDDKAFALSYAQSRLFQRVMGKRLLKQELLQKGIDEENADTAVAGAYDQVSETDLAKQLVEKKMRQLGAQDKRKVKHKLSDMLFRRGFDWDVISSVVREAMWEEES
ncbi:MAG TPA: RecX family transcriptional regulator [bacterium]